MKLEINLTDEQAAPILAALELLAHPLVTITPEPPAPALPDPPEGSHPAMMGPIPCPSGEDTHDIALWATGESEWDHTKWAGALPQIYALRIGSDIARLNGLEPEAIPADKDPER
jgi:hypothetical protein